MPEWRGAFRTASRRWRWVPAGVLPALASAAIGLAIAAATVSPLTAETSGGLYHSVTNLSYWTESSFVTATIPSSGTSAIATNKNVPTVLASAPASYTMGGQITAGDPALQFTFSEAHSAPTSTELKLVLTLSIGQLPATSTTTGYIETQTTIPGGSTAYDIYFDTSGNTAATIVIASITVQASQCASIGSC